MRRFAFAIALIVLLCASRAESQTLTTPVKFTGPGGGPASGKWPTGSLTLSGTTLYGTTNEGGANGIGNVFSVGTNGANYQNLVSFTGTGGTASGAMPYGKLLLSGMTLYGMTNGGANNSGNVSSVGTGGTNYQNLDSKGSPLAQQRA